jgi:uncharacterized protein (TIGR02453 family)
MADAVAGRFDGFSPAAIKFLRDLAKHNDRTWFAPRKPLYENECLAALNALVADASAALRKAKVPLGAGPKGAAFRIYRDVRFSPDKSPYKTNLGAFLTRSDRQAPGGLYIHIQPKNSFMAAGFYQLDKPLLQRWREDMATQPKRFAAVLRALERSGSPLSEGHAALKRMPRGFEAQAETALAPYFKAGSFMISETLTDNDVMSRALIDRMAAIGKRAKPLLDFGWGLVDTP